MFNWLFKKKKDKTTEDISNEKNQNKETSVNYHHGRRFLNISNTDCALILHEDDQCEIVFTKLYNADTQQITPNEELLMALAMFLKQNGFSEMILDEFRKIALSKSNVLFKEDNKENENGTK